MTEFAKGVPDYTKLLIASPFSLKKCPGLDNKLYGYFILSDSLWTFFFFAYSMNP